MAEQIEMTEVIRGSVVFLWETTFEIRLVD